jgi:hypothetical protein
MVRFGRATTLGLWKPSRASPPPAAVMSQYGIRLVISTSIGALRPAGGGLSATGVPSDTFTLRLCAQFAPSRAGTVR